MCFMERAISTTAAVEEWRPIAGFEGLYEVSNLGRVRSLDRVIEKIRIDGIPYKRTVNGQIIKSQKAKNGYIIAPLIKDRVRHSVLLHRALASAFIPNPSNLQCINHKDENKSNNSLDNLEWCDHKYNSNYGNGKYKKWDKRRRRFEQMTIDGKHIATFVRKSDCKFKTATINAALRGRLKTAYGYRWRYIDN